MSEEIVLRSSEFGHKIDQDDISVTYKWQREADPSIVSLRVIAPHLTLDGLFVQQFLKVARHSLAWEQPNILPTYKVGVEKETIYLLQKFTEARRLSKVLESDGAFSAKRMLKLARQIGAALDYAHDHDLHHGDLSLDCIFVGQHDHVWVADFGYTQAMHGTGLVKQGYPLGTLATLAPERLQGQPPTRRTDLYALGTICYAMLTGSYPFNGTLPQVLYAHAYEAPRDINLLNPSVSLAVSQIVNRLLHKIGESRFANAAEFVTALAEVVDAPSADINQMADSSEDVPKPSVDETDIIADPLPSAKTARKSAADNPSEQATVLSAIAKTGQPAAKDVATTRMAAQSNVPRPPWWMSISFIAGVLLVLFSSGVGLASVWQISQVSQASPPATSTDSRIAAVTVTRQPTTRPTNTPALMLMTDLAPSRLPTPGSPTIADDSPFTNLRLARQITADSQPSGVDTAFAVSNHPLYLFFDYANIPPNTTWGHRWMWADTEIGAYQAVWQDEGEGTAWIFFVPEGGYQAGPYEVTLSIEGRVVATATFVINW